MTCSIAVSSLCGRSIPRCYHWGPCIACWTASCHGTLHADDACSFQAFVACAPAELRCNVPKDEEFVRKHKAALKPQTLVGWLVRPLLSASYAPFWYMTKMDSCSYYEPRNSLLGPGPPMDAVLLTGDGDRAGVLRLSSWAGGGWLPCASRWLRHRHRALRPLRRHALRRPWPSFLSTVFFL